MKHAILHLPAKCRRIARTLRIEFPGALYRLIARNNARQFVVMQDLTPIVLLLLPAYVDAVAHCYYLGVNVRDPLNRTRNPDGRLLSTRLSALLYEGGRVRRSLRNNGSRWNYLARFRAMRTMRPLYIRGL